MLVDLDIMKSMGDHFAKEFYSFDHRRNVINLIFENSNDQQKIQFPTPPKFHMTTPTMASAFYFIKSKKLEQVGKNYFSVIHNYNHWYFEK